MGAAGSTTNRGIRNTTNTAPSHVARASPESTDQKGLAYWLNKISGLICKPFTWLWTNVKEPCKKKAAEAETALDLKPDAISRVAEKGKKYLDASVEFFNNKVLKPAGEFITKKAEGTRFEKTTKKASTFWGKLDTSTKWLSAGALFAVCSYGWSWIKWPFEALADTLSSDEKHQDGQSGKTGVSEAGDSEWGLNTSTAIYAGGALAVAGTGLAVWKFWPDLKSWWNNHFGGGDDTSEYHDEETPTYGADGRQSYRDDQAPRPKDDKPGMSKGVLVAIILGSVGALVFIAFAVWACTRGKGGHHDDYPQGYPGDYGDEQYYP